jgi:MYXO-CTERM domain-containing protein
LLRRERRLTPTGECPWPGDQLRFTVVAPAPDLRLGFDDWRARAPEHFGADAAVVGLAPGRELADYREDPAAPRLVIANALDVPLMRLDDSGGRLYWPSSDVPLELVGEAVTAVEPHDDPEQGFFEFQQPGELPLRMELDGAARVRATLPDGQVLESPELIGVSSVEAASLDLVVLVDAATGSPNYAFAEVRDAEGRVLHGAVVEWSMQAGALAVTPGNLELEVRTAEYALLGSGCEPRSSVPLERSAVLRARFGALEDTVELHWTDEALDPDVTPLPFTPDEACLFADDSDTDGETGGDDAGAELDDGCGCSSGRETPTAWLLALIGLGLLRRRKDA